MKHKSVSNGYTLTASDSGCLLEIVSGTLNSPPIQNDPGAATPGFSAYIAVTGNSDATFALQAGQVAPGGASGFTIPGGSVKEVVLLTGGKWALR